MADDGDRRLALAEEKAVIEKRLHDLNDTLSKLALEVNSRRRNLPFRSCARSSPSTMI